MTSDERVLFDVGPIALAHAGTPVSEPALSYVRQAIRGEFDAVVPTAAVVGAHHVLRRVYRIPRAEATHLLTNFLDAGRVTWYEGPRSVGVRRALLTAGKHNVDGWDGYYAHVAAETGADRLLTLDSDFEAVDGVAPEVVLSTEEFEELDRYVDELAG